MKKIIIAGAISILSLQAQAQLIEITEETENYDFSAKNILSYMIPKFDSIGVSSLVDQMRSDGVKERKFNAAFDVKGHFLGLDSAVYEGVEAYQVLPFTITLSTDNKYLLTASLLGEGERRLKYSMKVGKTKPEFTKLRLLTFILDDGLEFRDIRTLGFKVFEAELSVPVVAKTHESYIAIVAGMEWGYQKEIINLEDGSKLILQGHKSKDFDWRRGAFPRGNLAANFGAQTGVEASEPYKGGKLLFRGILDYSRFRTGNNIELSDGTFEWDKLAHSRLYLKPEVTFNRPVGKRTIDMGLGANIPLVDKLHSVDNGEDMPKLNLQDRNRNLINATIRLNF